MPGNHLQIPVFVYGSLLDSSRRVEILGREVETRAAILPGYERRRGRYFYVVPREGSETIGAILLNIDAQDLSALDRYEEVPDLYTRQCVEVVSSEGAHVTCWCYLPAALLTGKG